MADEWVLNVQQWVNAKYQGRPGYVACAETGNPAWSTMYSLTRAFQIELGLPSPSDAFGPATMSAISSRGGITSNDSTDLLSLIQAALWVKGYFAYSLNGWSDYVWIAMSRLRIDLGVPFSAPFQALDAKTLKQTFRMDAAVLVARGSSAVREVQQWMNANYISRRDFQYVPTDGHFGRDVQKSFLRVIQYELGMSDDVATGTFGPATQTGLRTKVVLEGSMGRWVEIFTAALVFNGYGFFSNSLNTSLSEQVKKFQSFSALPETGKSDFATWAQLLVSSGDPNRLALAADTSTPLTVERAATLRTTGVQLVGRYLDNVDIPNALNKKIQPGELQTIFAAGMSVFPIQQYSGNALQFFTHARGRQDALAAHDRAIDLGFPRGTTIYFAVDFDATDEQISSHIVPYFNGVVSGLVSKGKRYFHGVYACRNVCTRVTEETGALWSFVLGMSTGYSGNMGFKLPSNWSLNQIQTADAGTGSSHIQYDRNVTRPGSDPGVSSLTQSNNSVADYLDHVSEVEDLARVFTSTDADTPDDPIELTLQYLRSRNRIYTGLNWKVLYGSVSDSFVKHVENHVSSPVVRFVDPFYGVEYDAPHLAASANIHYALENATAGDANATDISSWGGDLMTFYAEWRRYSDGTASGYTFSRQNLFKLSAPQSSSFGLEDLLADADAVEVARALNQGSISVRDAIEQRLTGANSGRRIKSFLENRFGSEHLAERAAHDILTKANPGVSVPREALIQMTTSGAASPSILPSATLDSFTEGFAAELASLAAAEI